MTTEWPPFRASLQFQWEPPSELRDLRPQPQHAKTPLLQRLPLLPTIPGLTMSPKERVPEVLALWFRPFPVDHSSWSRVFQDLVLSAHLKFSMQMEHRSQLLESVSAPLKFLMDSTLSIFHLLLDGGSQHVKVSHFLPQGMIQLCSPKGTI